MPPSQLDLMPTDSSECKCSWSVLAVMSSAWAGLGAPVLASAPHRMKCLSSGGLASTCNPSLLGPIAYQSTPPFPRMATVKIHLTIVSGFYEFTGVFEILVVIVIKCLGQCEGHTVSSHHYKCMQTIVNIDVLLL